MELDGSVGTVTDDRVRVTALDEDAVARAAAGDERAFASLVAAHHADMLRLAGSILGDPDAARDAVQSAWQRAWTGLARLRDRTRVRSWLLSIAANEARQTLRRRRPAAALDDGRLDVVADPVAYFEDFDLHKALDRLEPSDRELLGLRYVLGYNSTELARHIGITPAGVRARLKKLVDRLRSELSDE